MKFLRIPLFLLLLHFGYRSDAQTDSTRFAADTGVYFITNNSFPVQDVTIYWKDTTLAFSAGGAHGTLKLLEENRFSFALSDRQGTVEFKKDDKGIVESLLVFMDGDQYEGIKKRTVPNSQQ